MTSPKDGESEVANEQPNEAKVEENQAPEQVTLSKAEYEALKTDAAALRSSQPWIEKLVRRLDNFENITKEEINQLRKGNEVLLSTVAEFEEEVTDDDSGEKKTVKRQNTKAIEFLNESQKLRQEQAVKADIAFALASHGYQMTDPRFANAKTVVEALSRVATAKEEDAKLVDASVNAAANDKAKALHNESLTKQAKDLNPKSVVPSGDVGALTIEDVKKMTPEERNRRTAEIAKLSLGI